jgi:hypothetical protein
MKKLLLLAWLFANILSCLAATKEEVLENDIARSKSMTDENKVKHLMEIVEFRARYNVPRSQRELDLIQEAISEVIKTPGHAEFFAEEVRRKQKEVAHIPPIPVGNRNEYDTLRRITIRYTLSKMPSPETVKVLGEFLSDDKDLPEGVIPGDYYANNGYAIWALKKIGLRNPAENHPYDDSPSCLKKWQAWYERVKAGEITFSFEGQPHEYRFQPDGTWITIPLEKSEDSPEPEKESVPPATSLQGHSPAEQAPSRKSPWIFVGGFLMLGVLSLLIHRFRKRRAGEKLA